MRFLVLILAVFLLSSCSTARSRFEPGTLRINIGAEPPSLDWHVSTDSVSFDVVSNIMVGLTQYNNQLKCDPSCAASWDVLDGGRRYIFHLRPDVYWSDGRKLVASDFEYAWKRILTPATGSQYAYFLYDIENAFEYNTGKIKDPAAIGVKALNGQTLEVRLKKPAAYFIYLTAFCPTYPQRKDIIERWGDRWTEPEHMVSNGPFMLKTWDHEYKIELVAYPRFFEGEPPLKRIKMFMVPEQSTAFALYENDELDFIDNRSFSTPDVERSRNSPEYRNIPLLRGHYIGFNVTKKPFVDPLVRRAFAMSIDRSIFPRILRRGERPANTWIPPGMLGYSATSGIAYDPGQARQLLAQAGYPNGAGFPATGLLYPNREDTRLIVEALQDQLKRTLNVHVDLVNQEWKVYLETLHRDPPPLSRGSWGADYPDPETFMNLFTTYNGNNSTRWSNKQYDDLISQAEGEQDHKKRGQLYELADKLLCVEDAPMSPVFWDSQNIMVKPWVQGMEFNALDVVFFKKVSVGQTTVPLLKPGTPPPIPSPLSSRPRKKELSFQPTTGGTVCSG